MSVIEEHLNQSVSPPASWEGLIRTHIAVRVAEYLEVVQSSITGSWKRAIRVDIGVVSHE